MSSTTAKFKLNVIYVTIFRFYVVSNVFLQYTFQFCDAKKDMKPQC